MKFFKRIITGIIILIVLAACGPSEPDPTATPMEDLPEATAVPTNLPATPEISEPETYPAQVVSYNLGDATIIQVAELTAVELTNITEVALIFDQTPSGSLFMADLELVK